MKDTMDFIVWVLILNKNEHFVISRAQKVIVITRKL